MKLSSKQQEAFDKIKEFLTSPVPIFILKGYAGTGKTFLIKVIADYLAESKKNYKLIAPTGRAARVLTERTKHTAATIHKAIYKKTLSEVSSDERLIFNFEINSNDESEKILIVDESSMVSDNVSTQEHLKFGSGRLLLDLFEYLNLTVSSDIHNKIIFVGDDAQLPPINSNDSPALSKNYLLKTYNLESEEFKLIDVFRQDKESGIIKNATKIREYIEASVYNYFKIDTSDDVILFRPENRWEEIAKMMKNGDTALITYTNESAYEYNSLIRTRYFNNDLPEIQPGDKLLVNSNNFLYNLYNGDIGTVINVFPAIVEIVNIKNLDQPVTLTYRSLDISFNGVKNNYTILENLLYSTNRGLTTEESRAMYILAYRKCGKQKPPKELKETDPHKYEILKKEYILAMENSPYLSALQVKFAYAVTCHKAQGGEWANVFVDFSSFSSYDNILFYRWAYTAITRSSEKLFLLNTVEGTPWAKAKLKFFAKSRELIFETTPTDPIVIYTDGSDIKGTGMIGYGVWFNFHNNIHKISGIENVAEFKQKYNLENDISNPTMEVKALVASLKEFKNKKVDLVIKSDYKGVQKWVLGLWKINKPYIKDLVDEAKSYILSIEKLGGTVRLEWVKGHQIKSNYESAEQRIDRIGNEIVDKIAKDRYEYNTLQGKYPPNSSFGADNISDELPAEESDSKPEIEYSAEFPNECCLNLHRDILKILEGTGYTIAKTETLQFRQRYSLIGEEENILIMDFVYNKKGIISPSVKKRNNVYSETGLISKFLAIVNSETEKNSEKIESFPQPFLEDYYKFVKEQFLPDGIEIIDVQHLNYLERYRFKKENDVAYIDIYYNGKGIITKKIVSLGKPSSKALSKYILNKILIM